MKLEYISLLQTERDLYNLPHGMKRFQEYLKTMQDPETKDLKLPLSSLNPMGKEHVPEFLDRLLSIDADGEGQKATAATAKHLSADAGEYNVCLVVSDDLKGGWTNRYTAEFEYRFRQHAYYRRGWLPVLLWTSESYSPQSIRNEVSASIFRVAYVNQHGEAHNLRDMSRQEGLVLSQSQIKTPTLDAADLEYTRQVLEPYLASTDQPTVLTALFGDSAARQLGYPSLGLSDRAGLALALADYRGE